MEPQPRSPAMPFVVTLCALAAVALGASVVMLARSTAWRSTSFWLTGLLLVALFLLLQRKGILLQWRDQRMQMHFDEAVMVAALVFLPAAALVPLLFLGVLPTQALQGRRGIRATFNAASFTAAGGAGALVAAACGASGAPTVVGALAGAATVSLLTSLFLARVLASVEGLRTLQVFRERVVAPSVVMGTLGIGVGAALVAMALLHLALPILLVPLMMFLQHHSESASRLDAQVRAHGRLAAMHRDLVGQTDEATVAAHVLDACGDLFDAHTVELSLESEAGPLTFRRDYRAGDPETGRVLEVHLDGGGGRPLGHIYLYPHRRVHSSFLPVDREMLRIVAAQAAAAVDNARSLRALDEVRRRSALTERLSALGTLVAGVAHEINNPLMFMQGNTELNQLELEDLLLRDDLAPETRDALRASLERDLFVLRGLDQVANITRSLKHVARQNNGVRRPEDVNEILESVLTVASARVGSGVTVERRLEAQRLVQISSSEMMQVFLNLVFNAADAMADRTGRLEIRTRDEDDRVVVEVEDTGPGIPQDNHDQIFHPFHTTKPNGTGLGLSVSHAIVHEHGGRIGFRTRPGLGTTFIVELPAEAAPLMAPLPDAASRERTST